ncbi:elongation factor 1-beta [Candidatus Woesearchaeota archaeon]|nr:elongation factor 1-beta [Candidatus Woesearchaeota archaeon]
MANVVVTIRIMPTSPDVDLGVIEEEAKKKIREFTGIDEFRTSIEPIAFGLKALMITFLSPEEKGDTEPLEKELEGIEGVESIQVVDVRRAVG